MDNMKIKKWIEGIALKRDESLKATYEWIGEEIGVSGNSIRHWRSGYRQPSGSAKKLFELLMKEHPISQEGTAS